MMLEIEVTLPLLTGQTEMRKGRINLDHIVTRRSVDDDAEGPTRIFLTGHREMFVVENMRQIDDLIRIAQRREFQWQAEYFARLLKQFG